MSFDDVLGNVRGRTRKLAVLPQPVPYSKTVIGENIYAKPDDGQWKTPTGELYYYAPPKGSVFTLPIEEFDEETVADWNPGEADEFFSFVGGETKVTFVVTASPYDYCYLGRIAEENYAVLQDSDLIPVRAYAGDDTFETMLSAYMLDGQIEEVSSKVSLYDIALGNIPTPLSEAATVYPFPPINCWLTITPALVERMVYTYYDEDEEEEYRQVLASHVGERFQVSLAMYDESKRHLVRTDAGRELSVLEKGTDCNFLLTPRVSDFDFIIGKIEDVDQPSVAWSKELPSVPGRKTARWT
jgi:hypothetical protein